MSLNQLYARYGKGTAAHTIRELKNHEVPNLSVEDRWLKEYSRDIPVFFQGVFDTVGALGVPFGHIPVLSRSNYRFLETDLRINDAFAYHALAIDEHREAFAPTLWKKTVKSGAQTYPPRTLAQVEQRWFVGAHADVGGGYDDGLLAQVPLRWLMAKAQSHGLAFKDTVNIDGDENQAAIHNSFREMASGIYSACKLWRPYFREIGAAPVANGDETTTTINESIDGSVFDRWRNDATYRPENLAMWATRHNVRIESLEDPVQADNPMLTVPEAA